MDTSMRELSWAPRVQRSKIFRLYQTEAMGIYDKELLHDVAFSLYSRCESIVTVTEAAQGRVKCPRCDSLILRQGGKGEVIQCRECSWAITWDDYFKSYHRKQLYGGNAIDAVIAFVQAFPSAVESPQRLMLLIDKLIHECHKGITPPNQEQLYSRPLAVNLIEGTMTQVIAFLENLPYGPGTQPEMRDNLISWRRRVLSVLREQRKYRKE